MTNTPVAQHISKAEINQLPMRHYEGPIHLIKTADDARRAAEELRMESVLGFDTETRAAFRVGESYRPSVLQLAGSKDVFVFQIELTGLIPELCEILSCPKIVKAGVAIRGDLKELHKLASFESEGFVELANYAKKAKIKNLGLRGLGALLLGFRISKGEQVSNWAKRDLSPSQIKYAATDAWVGREIYLRMDQLGMTAPSK